MAISLNWTVDADGGYMYEDELSDVLRTALQPLTKFRQFCEPDEDALNKGLHRGERFSWNVYGDLATQGRRLSELSPMPETSFSVSQSSLTVVEMGNSVPYTGKLTALAKHDVLRIINKALKNDARKAFDIEAWTQFNACKLRAAPTSGTSTTSVTITENASTATTNNVALGTGHVKAIVDEMRERNVPGFAEDDYVAISHPTTLRPFKNELESIRQYTNEGLTKVYNGEIGRYEGTRFVEQDFVPKGGAIDSTTFDPYTRTADAWNNAKSSWAFFFGADTVNEAVVIPEEIRAKLPGDFGRSGGIAWYYLGGFGLVNTEAAQARVIQWDSAA
jgi:N4-gp56 family major capsid protein